MVSRRQILAGIAGCLAARHAPAIIGARSLAFTKTQGGVQSFDWIRGDGVAYCALPMNAGVDVSWDITFEMTDRWQFGEFFGGYSPWGSTASNPRYTNLCYLNSLEDSRCYVRYGDSSGVYGWFRGILPQTVGSIANVAFNPLTSSLVVNGQSVTIDVPSENTIPSSISEINMGVFSTMTENFTPRGARDIIFRKIKVWVGDELRFDSAFHDVNGEGLIYNTVTDTYLDVLGGGHLTVGND